MKRLSVLAFALAIALSTFARSSSNSTDAMTNFMCMVVILWGGLNIILFFKLWGMTNDVAMLKKKFLNHSEELDKEKQLRDLILMGRKEEAKEIMIRRFSLQLEAELKMLDKKSSPTAVKDFMKKPIAPYVKILEQYLKIIGEPVPETIMKFRTIGDYFDLITIRLESEGTESKQ